MLKTWTEMKDKEDRRIIEGEILEQYSRWISKKEKLHDKTR